MRSYKLESDALRVAIGQAADEMVEAAVHLDLSVIRAGGYRLISGGRTRPDRAAILWGMARGLRLAASLLRDDVLGSDDQDVGGTGA